MDDKLSHDLLMYVMSLALTSEPVWSGGIVLIPPPQGKLQSRNEETWLELFKGETKRAREESTAGWCRSLNSEEVPHVCWLQAELNCCCQKELPLLG